MKARKPVTWIPDRPDQRGAAPAKLGELLVGAETFLKQRSGCAIPREEWRQLVGARIANRTRVGRLSRGMLTLYVATSAWSNELSFLKADILTKLQQAGREVSDLRLIVDQIARTAPLRRSAAPAQREPSVELPPELLARLNQVEDLNLRAAIAQAARHSLAPRKAEPVSKGHSRQSSHSTRKPPQKP